MFYDYSQNNTWGTFEIDHKRGITTYVVIEADSPEEANERAEDIGMYFDGEGDCSCCGRRWYPIDDDEKGDEFPSVYGTPVWGYNPGSYTTHRAGGGAPYVYVHFADGSWAGVVSRGGKVFAVQAVQEEGSWTFVPVALGRLEGPKKLSSVPEDYMTDGPWEIA